MLSVNIFTDMPISAYPVLICTVVLIPVTAMASSLYIDHTLLLHSFLHYLSQLCWAIIRVVWRFSALLLSSITLNILMLSIIRNCVVVNMRSSTVAVTVVVLAPVPVITIATILLVYYCTVYVSNVLLWLLPLLTAF